MDALESGLGELLPRTAWTRRGFIVTSLASGFALSVQPVSAETITTDTNGLDAAEVKVPVPDGSIPAYRAMPAQGGPFPTVLVVQEIFGVHEHIKDICRRLAKSGYYAIAPELFARQGNPAAISDIQQLIKTIVSKVPDAQVMSDLDAAGSYAKASGKADAARLAVTGFCWGGRIVWLYAAHNPGLKAAVAWYGPIDRPRTELQPKYPIDLAAELKAPVLGLYGGADQSIPVESVERMRAACKQAGKICEIKIYPDAPHGFNADYRPSYHADAARDGWARMLAWFKDHRVA
ncbi:MAG: dienelactone hydrolase family protein [Alphaproteobacteria bacterium]|nr:dienelactone hydrolase family protein [Alphaproteobacteria bacterium]